MVATFGLAHGLFVKLPQQSDKNTKIGMGQPKYLLFNIRR
jgi:hypothetical protein